MSTLRLCPLLLFAAALVAAPAAAQEPPPLLAATPPAAEPGAREATPSPVSVVATASQDEVTVGETFTIELKAMGPPGTTWRFASGASEDEIELQTPETAEGAPVPEPATHVYEASVYALGEVTIPPIPVRYVLPDGTEGEAESEPIEIEVGSLLPREADEQKLADIQGPQTVGIGRAFWAAVIVALLVLAGLVTWLIRRRRREATSEAPVVPETPADVEALRALDELAASGLLQRGEYRPFYIRLTAVAKRYLERRLAAPVLEMTTSETLAFLRSHADGGDLLPVVRDLSQAGDQIKFARGAGLTEAAEGHLAAVRTLVPALEGRLRPSEPVPSEEGRAA